MLPKSDHFRIARERMVENQIAARGIRDKRVLEAMKKVPRHLFVDEALWDQAYGDFPLPIGRGQTISQPYIVARMTEELGLKGDEKVLEIGTGSGYQTAILAELARQVFSVERIADLLQRARQTLDRLGYHNVMIKLDDGTWGWKEHAPYDAILVTAGSPVIPTPLLDQLKDPGVMVVPVGDEYSQTLTKVTKRDGKIDTEYLEGVRFVKLIGDHGWRA
ncbi:MAG: protein-L-isoaspartate(D-aspartate) O-methyltransferase [Thermodesulfobacteria bacterium]|nr:protein-L-isoaspartate(D-aspartate) O-methyltransferase [Thermodesulfobacteriota bacterium]